MPSIEDGLRQCSEQLFDGPDDPGVKSKRIGNVSLRHNRAIVLVYTASLRIFHCAPFPLGTVASW